MKIHNVIAATALCMTVAHAALGFDSIKTAKSTLIGRVAEMSPKSVKLEGVGESIKEVPVNEIQTIFFETDPSELKTAKTHVLGGRYRDALTALERIKQADVTRKENQQDIDFYKAFCTSKLALAGSLKIPDAGRMMKAFVDNNPNSYHYFEASEIVGDLLVAIQQFPQAADYYARLKNAPWPDYQMRAGVAEGRALLAQGKVSEAENAFNRVIDTIAEGDLAQSQRIAARLGKAAALTAAKKSEAAILIIEDVLKTANPEDAALMARAYNALGNAYRQSGNTKEALLAFLHVDVLYPSQPDTHAEALANLMELWQEVHKTERANAARQILEKDYKDSPWTRKAGGAN